MLVWGFFGGLMVGCMPIGRATATRVPVTVESVNWEDSLVVLSAADNRVPATFGFFVHDPSAYEVGDHVNVLLAGEEQKPYTLDREPLVPEVVEAVQGIAVATLASIVIGLIVVARVTYVRRRALSSAWKRVPAIAWQDGNTWFVFLPTVEAGSFWRLSDPLDAAGSFEAQVAGTPKRLTLRAPRRVHLIVARRQCARAEWSRQRVLGWDRDGSTLACLIREASDVMLYQFESGPDVVTAAAEGASLPGGVDVLRGPSRIAVRTADWPTPGIATAIDKAAADRWSELTALADEHESVGR